MILNDSLTRNKDWDSYPFTFTIITMRENSEDVAIYREWSNVPWQNVKIWIYRLFIHEFVMIYLSNNGHSRHSRHRMP